MNIIKTSIIISYYLIVTVCIIFFNQRLKSKTGNKVGGSMDLKKIPKSLIWLPLLATLAMFFYIAFPIVQLFIPSFYSYLFPLLILNNFISFIIGSILIVIGLIIFILSQIQLGNSYRILLTEEKVKLITSGLYSVTRNPLYLGAYLSFIGIFLFFPSIIFTIIMLILIFNNHFRIREEEKALLEFYKEEYADYRKKVKRYFLFF